MNWTEIRGTAGRVELPQLVADAWDQCEFDSVDVLTSALEDAWTQPEWPERMLPPLIWLQMFSEAGFQVDGVRRPLPAQPIRLFRGATYERRRGWSWTDDVDRAKWFANRFGGGASVWTTEAPPKRLLAHFKQARRESEWVVYTRSLRVQLASEHVMRRSLLARALRA